MAAKKRGLGRGLDALLGGDAEPMTHTADGEGELRTLEIQAIQPGTNSSSPARKNPVTSKLRPNRTAITWTVAAGHAKAATSDTIINGLIAVGGWGNGNQFLTDASIVPVAISW